jgi:hypothetical protein
MKNISIRSGEGRRKKCTNNELLLFLSIYTSRGAAKYATKENGKMF